MMRKIVYLLVIFIMVGIMLPINIDTQIAKAASLTFYPDADPESTSVDGSVVYWTGSVSWDTLHDSSDGSGTYPSNDSMQVLITAGSTTDTWSKLNRCFLLFDTSALPDTATIVSATLSLYGSSKSDLLYITPSLGVYSSSPASDTNLVNGDYDQVGGTLYSDVISYNSISTSGYNDFTLNSSGMAAISKTGISKFSVRNYNYDALDTEPDWTQAMSSTLTFYSADKGSGYKPKLDITYITTPTVTTNAASDVSIETAQLNGYLNDDGGDDCEYRFSWDEDGSPYDNTTEWTGDINSGESFNAILSGLDPSTTYHYRAECRNDDYTGTGADTTFTTGALPSEPTNFVAVAKSDNTVSLSWTKGDYSSDTTIRYQTGTYPTGYADGESAYFGTSSSYDLTGLDDGTTYFFSAWGFGSPDYYSASYAYCAITTHPDAGEVDLTLPSQGDTDITPDISDHEDTFWYPIIYWMSGAWQLTSVGLGLRLFGMIMIALLSITIAYTSADLLVTLIATLVMLAIGNIFGVVPFWAVLIYAIPSCAIAYVKGNAHA